MIGCGTCLQKLPRLAHEPFVAAALQLGQLKAGEFGEIQIVRPSFAVGDFIDAAAGAVDAVVLVAFSNVLPIEHVHAAVRAVAQLDATKPLVGGTHEVRRVLADVARALAMQRVLIHAQAVEV